MEKSSSTRTSQAGVFGEVPEDILERVKYVESVENRLLTNTSGVRYKTDRQIISSIHVNADASVATNYRMHEFKNVDVVVPFAVVRESRWPRRWGQRGLQ